LQHLGYRVRTVWPVQSAARVRAGPGAVAW